MTSDSLASWLQAELSRLLDVAPERIAHDTHLLDLGLDSLTAVRLCGAVGEKLGVEVDPMLVFDCPTIAEMVVHLRSAHAPSA